MTQTEPSTTGIQLPQLQCERWIQASKNTPQYMHCTTLANWFTACVWTHREAGRLSSKQKRKWIIHPPAFLHAAVYLCHFSHFPFSPSNGQLCPQGLSDHHAHRHAIMCTLHHKAGDARCGWPIMWYATDSWPVEEWRPVMSASTLHPITALS